MVVYLKLMEVGGRENNGGVFLLIVPGVYVSVSAPYVMGKYRSVVLRSVAPCEAIIKVTCVGHVPMLCALSARKNTSFYPC